MLKTLINLKFSTFHKSSCFNHVLSKTCQHACNDTNVCVGFQNVNLTTTQSTLRKTIIQIKKFDEGCKEWRKACFDLGLFH